MQTVQSKRIKHACVNTPPQRREAGLWGPPTWQRLDHIRCCDSGKVPFLFLKNRKFYLFALIHKNNTHKRASFSLLALLEKLGSTGLNQVELRGCPQHWEVCLCVYQQQQQGRGHCRWNSGGRRSRCPHPWQENHNIHHRLDILRVFKSQLKRPEKGWVSEASLQMEQSAEHVVLGGMTEHLYHASAVCMHIWVLAAFSQDSETSCNS